ncbi:hypothetical protein BDY19DRAFT_910611 [Irpex rosettiformis]|uniref:Uncharacterized protein n=1 Tax=Irpex rosettiformis TaxID=378272 RepID=A0ACB8TNA0_9APHY|nr:hypothetical protein BDY19DRAFT_910611 [Irpex rosettiformis]
MLLSDIAAAHGHPITDDNGPTSHPFNLLLTSVAIAGCFVAYPATRHTLSDTSPPPSSINYLPRSRQNICLWDEQKSRSQRQISRSLYLVLVSRNKSMKVEWFVEYSVKTSISNAPLISAADARDRGNNHRVGSFLRATLRRKDTKGVLKLKKARILSQQRDFKLIVTSPTMSTEKCGERGTSEVTEFTNQSIRGEDLRARVHSTTPWSTLSIRLGLDDQWTAFVKDLLIPLFSVVFRALEEAIWERPMEELLGTPLYHPEQLLGHR